MASSHTDQVILDGARNIPTSEELKEAFAVEVYDRAGDKKHLGDLIDGKISILIFTRHFWCLNCQAYVRIISEKIPPAKLPSNTQIIVIGNGSYQPIDTYATTTASAYPIYTDPTCQLHKILKFKSGLKEAGEGEAKKDYMKDAGSAMNRIFGGIKGALGNLQHTPYIGPKSLNGGELIISSDGTCEYIYRMQNTVDHTSVMELAGMIGVVPDDAGKADVKE